MVPLVIAATSPLDNGHAATEGRFSAPLGFRQGRNRPLEAMWAGRCTRRGIVLKVAWGIRRAGCVSGIFAWSHLLVHLMRQTFMSEARFSHVVAQKARVRARGCDARLRQTWCSPAIMGMVL